MIKYFLCTIFFFGLLSTCALENNARVQPLKIAIIGFGGRAQWLLTECLKKKQDICVVAICDDNAHACIDTQARKLAQTDPTLFSAYQAALAQVTVYSNTTQDLSRLFAQHKDALDVVFITSANNDHFNHLNAVLDFSDVKKIFMEKPLFKTLEEFNTFDFKKAKTREVAIGLTLRYSSMAHIVAAQLQEHKARLGALKNIDIWERLNFRHAFTAFIMGGWRRYKSSSGGFMLEKVIHDLDLALFFMDALGVEPHAITLSTESAHKFFLKSHKDKILEYILNNPGFRQQAELKSRAWDLFDFIRNPDGIDWQASLDKIFEEYPDDDFGSKNSTNLIPDYQKLTAQVATTSGGSFDVKLEVDMADFRTATERGQRFVFEQGDVLIDVMGSKMHITYIDGSEYVYDLKTNGSDHADGDDYIIDTIIGKPLPHGYTIALLNDPLVKLANLMVLISEAQVEYDNKIMYIKKNSHDWVITN